MATTNVNLDGTTQVFGGKEGLAFSRATAANSNYVNDSDGRIRHVAFKLDGLQTFPVVAARAFRPSAGSAWGASTCPPARPRGSTTRARPRASIGSASTTSTRTGSTRRRCAARSSWSATPTPVDQDLHPTSVSGDALTPGPEIQASAINTVSRGLPDHGRAAVARHAAAPGARPAHAARRAATADLPRARHRRGGAGRLPRRRPGRLQPRHDADGRLSGARRHPRPPRHRAHPRRDCGLRARAGARRLRAFRPRGRGRRGAAQRRWRAPGRRPARGDRHVQRPARLHLVRRDARTGGRHRRR